MANRNRGNRGNRGGGGGRSGGGRGGSGGTGGAGTGGTGGSGGTGGAGTGGAGTGAYGRRSSFTSGGQTYYYIPGTEEFGVPMGYRRADGSYVTGLRNSAGRQIEFRSDKERADYEFEARMQAQIHRRQEEAAANARKAYLELAGSIAVVREALFVLAKTYEPLIAESRAFKDAQRQLAESAAFSGMSFKELTKIQQEAMRSLQLNAKTAAEVVSTMSQLSSQAGVVGKTMENVSGLFDLATARGVTLKEAVLGMKQALSGSLEGTPLADKLFMKDLRAVLSDYAQTIGKRTLFDLTQAEKATAVMKEFERQVSLVGGSYERFLETTSGKQAVFTERMEEFAAAVGHRLDKALSSVQMSLSSVIGVFMELDKSTGGAMSTFVSFAFFAGTVRVALLGLVGTLTAVTHSLKSLNIEIGNTAKVITFLQQRALLIVSVMTALVSVFSSFGESVQESSLSLKEALVPLEEYIRKTNAARVSLDSETAALNENTSAIKRNRLERENRSKVQVEVRRGVAADVDLTLGKLRSEGYSQAEKEKAVMELFESLYSDAGGWFGQLTHPFVADVKRLLGKEGEYSREEISSMSMIRLYENIRKGFSGLDVKGKGLFLPSSFYGTLQPGDFRALINDVKRQMEGRGVTGAERDAMVRSVIEKALEYEIKEQGRVVAGEQEKLKEIQRDSEREQKVLVKPKLDRPVIIDGKIHIPVGGDTSEVKGDTSGVSGVKGLKPVGSLYYSGSPYYASGGEGEGGGVKPSSAYENAVEISVKEFMGSVKDKIRVLDADTYLFESGGAKVLGRLLGVDAFEVVPVGGQTKREAEKALEQAAKIMGFDYGGEEKLQAGSMEYAAKVLSERLGAKHPRELLKRLEGEKEFLEKVRMLKGKNGVLTEEEAKQIAFIDYLGREQVKMVEEMLSAGVTGLVGYGTDSYQRPLIGLEVGGEPLSGLLLRSGAFAYMESKMGKDTVPSPEDIQRQNYVQALRSYLPDRVGRRGGGGGRALREKMRRVPNQYLPEDVEVEMMRLEAQDERFRRDNVPEVLKSVISDLNYQTSYVSSMERLVRRFEEKLERRVRDISELKGRLEEAKRVGDKEEVMVLEEEVRSAEQALLVSVESVERLKSRVGEQVGIVNQLTPMKIGRTIGDLVRSGKMSREGARVSFREAFGYTVGGADKGIVMGVNEELGRAFEYMMSLPEGDRERLRPAFEAYVGSVRAGRLSQLSQAAVSIFQSGNILGAGDMSTRGLALAGALSSGFTQASSGFVSGVLSAVAGGKALDSRAVFELKEMEYRKRRESLLQEDFETEKERRLRLQVLEEERAEYLESQVDTFGSRLRAVFSETADFAGQVFNQVLTQLLVSSVTQGAGRSLLSAALGFIPGGSAIAGFLGLSSGGVMPGGSVAVVGENPDGTLNRTSEVVASGGVARVFNNMQTNRIVNQLGVLGSMSGGVREVKMEARQVELLGELVRESKRAMVMTEVGGEVLAKRSLDYSDYRDRFIDRY